MFAVMAMDKRLAAVGQNYTKLKTQWPDATAEAEKLCKAVFGSE